jgi:galactoside O-acetyltransferase
MDNLFFDIRDLKKCGKNVIIGKTVRIRYPHLVEIADNVIIDDFTYISTQLIIEKCCHISSGSKLIGGINSKVIMREFSTLAPNVVLAAGSDDYISGIASPIVDKRFKGHCEFGQIELGKHSIVGANTTVMPNTHFGEGAAVGAQSLVKSNLDAWCLYAGIPAKRIKSRDKKRILELEENWNFENEQ